MPLLSLPCRCGIEQGFVAPASSRATSIIVIVPQIIQFNMFTYPPSPSIRAHDIMHMTHLNSHLRFTWKTELLHKVLLNR
jgi:hypothetical protein